MVLPPHRIRQDPFTSVSCPTTKFCAAIGQNASTTAVYATIYEPSH
ncbi:MAG TPA: hypothetical protein VFN61_16415 [Acidimicrobiales bacterium]|nr:hypothetical protein [Acidimicrobiales bacterium]